MKYTNDEIDEMIHKALDAEDKKYLEDMEQPNILELYIDTYRGKQKWLSVWVTIIMLIIIALTWYVAVQFFKTEGIREMLIFGFIFLTGLITITALKIWFWMQMNNVSILREIKRLELQIAMSKEKNN